LTLVPHLASKTFPSGFWISDCGFGIEEAAKSKEILDCGPGEIEAKDYFTG
jgi:hypothetical protein